MEKPGERPGLADAGAVPAVPGYEILEKVGEGGTGRVFRARRLAGGDVVAVKFFHRGDSLPARELHLTAALRHPHVVAVLDGGRAGAWPYLVLEYVAGPSLRGLMAPGVPWPGARAAAVLGAVAGALAYVHAQGLLHLDLKPENVLLAPDDSPKLTDFGLARPRGDGRVPSELGLAQGTLDYCSPEQRFGLALDARSDLFSLGTVAYELLSGQLPGRVYVPAARHNPALPAAADDLLRHALARDPEQRLASAEEFRTRLEAAWKRRSVR